MDFYPENSFSLMLPFKIYELKKYMGFEKGGNTQKVKGIFIGIAQSDSAYQKTLLSRFQALTCKMWNFVFFERRRIAGACFFFLFIFSTG